MTAEYPKEYPNTYLTLSAEPHTGRDNARTPDGLTYPSSEELRQHAKRMHGAPIERLQRSYIVQADGCWRWIKGITSVGYGHFWFRGAYYQAHVVVYIANGGVVPLGLEPDHTCRNRWCVAPGHIEFVTHAVNVQRGARSVLSPEQVAEIRRRGKAAGVRAMAREYGVDHATISRIVNGLIWVELAPAEAAA